MVDTMRDLRNMDVSQQRRALATLATQSKRAEACQKYKKDMQAGRKPKQDDGTPFDMAQCNGVDLEHYGR